MSQMRRDELRYQMDAFPSGTAGNAFAVGCFLALYLNAKLKAYSKNRTPFWKMLAVLAPLFGALMVTLVLLLMNVSLASSTLTPFELNRFLLRMRPPNYLTDLSLPSV